MKTFDWHALMKAGLIGLRLRPDDFWKLTPAEFALLMGNGSQDLPLSRTTMDALLAQFPDKRSEPDGSD